MTGAFGQETENEDKYGRQGRLESLLLRRFRARMLAELRPLDAHSVLDAGCGEGHVAAWLSDALAPDELVGVDGRAQALAGFRARNPRRSAVQSDLRALPFPDRAFDLVVCSEVLEHVPEPRDVLRELSRVSAAHVFITVPHEPFFRLGNVAAGRYLNRLGSTPGHLWTWSRRGFANVVRAEADPVRWISLFPWQAILARPRR
ncbi:MAG: class I SAM-dependent methyltransferase [Solirubrobacteraceae bacterium]